MNGEQRQSIQAIRIAKGQIESIIKMIEEERYCVEISNQIIAAQSLLKKANLLILKQHMNHCVMEAFQHDNGSDKIDEIIKLLSKVTSK